MKRRIKGLELPLYEEMPILRVAPWESIIEYIFKTRGIKTKVVTTTKGYPLVALIPSSIEITEFYQCDETYDILMVDNKGKIIDNIVSIIPEEDLELEGVCEQALDTGLFSIYDKPLTTNEIEHIFSLGVIEKPKYVTRADIEKLLGKSQSMIKVNAYLITPIARVKKEDTNIPPQVYSRDLYVFLERNKDRGFSVRKLFTTYNQERGLNV